MERFTIPVHTPTIKATPKVEVIKQIPDKTLTLQAQRFHLIGVGGVGMSALAQFLIKHQALVSGSDMHDSAVLTELKKAGVKIFIGHHQDHIHQQLDAVVVSAAVKDNNPELQRAQEKGCTIYKYAHMLGRLMRRYKGIAISGTHGKSTTSAWLSTLLRQSQVDINYIIGASCAQLQGSSGMGESPYFVVEACEYDRSFLNIRPHIACVLNIEQDHLDYYQDEQEIVNAFAQFVNGLCHRGTLVANGQDPNVTRILEHCRPDITCITFGFRSDCRLYARNLCLEDGTFAFDIIYDGRALGRIHISLAGRFNVLNALAVCAMAMQVGLPVPLILEGLPRFLGTDRRLTHMVTYNGITVIDDYAHHPTEIRATLEAIRQRYRPGRVWCVFQPHQYSRTRFLLDDFAESFKLADVTIVPEIYFVRDSLESKKAVNARMLVDRLQDNGCYAVFIEEFTAICDYLESHVTARDVVITMGAGDVWKVADEYIRRIRHHS